MTMALKTEHIIEGVSVHEMLRELADRTTHLPTLCWVHEGDTTFRATDARYESTCLFHFQMGRDFREQACEAVRIATERFPREGEFKRWMVVT